MEPQITAALRCRDGCRPLSRPLALLPCTIPCGRQIEAGKPPWGRDVTPSRRRPLLHSGCCSRLGPPAAPCRLRPDSRSHSRQQQSDARDAYDGALSRFRAILSERRGQIDAKQPLPNLPGQALYLARINMMSTYKDLTDALPSRIGRPNTFGMPPQYFDADNEPLVEEYRKLFDIMEAPPASAQNSPTPFKDVVELGIAIARAKGLDAAQRRGGRPDQPRAVLRGDQWPSKHRECPLQQLQGQLPDRTIRRPEWSKAMGRDEDIDRSAGSRLERAR